MTHLHIPDGIMPFWLWAGSYVVIFLLVYYFLNKVKKLSPIIYRKKLVHTGIISSIMILAMSIDLFLYHPNFSVLSGIILGANYSIFAAFIINIILSLFGHGSITTIGLNTLIIFIQMLMGIILFKFTAKIFKNNIFWRIFTTVFVALLVSTILTIFIITLGGEKWGLHSEEFTVLALIVSFAGIMIESLMSAGAGVYIKSVKPDIIESQLTTG